MFGDRIPRPEQAIVLWNEGKLDAAGGSRTTNWANTPAPAGRSENSADRPGGPLPEALFSPGTVAFVLPARPPKSLLDFGERFVVSRPLKDLMHSQRPNRGALVPVAVEFSKQETPPDSCRRPGARATNAAQLVGTVRSFYASMMTNDSVARLHTAPYKRPTLYVRYQRNALPSEMGQRRRSRARPRQKSGWRFLLEIFDPPRAPERLDLGLWETAHVLQVGRETTNRSPKVEQAFRRAGRLGRRRPYQEENNAFCSGPPGSTSALFSDRPGRRGSNFAQFVVGNHQRVELSLIPEHDGLLRVEEFGLPTYKSILRHRRRSRHSAMMLRHFLEHARPNIGPRFVARAPRERSCAPVSGLKTARENAPAQRRSMIVLSRSFSRTGENDRRQKAGKARHDWKNTIDPFRGNERHDNQSAEAPATSQKHLRRQPTLRRAIIVFSPSDDAIQSAKNSTARSDAGDAANKNRTAAPEAPIVKRPANSRRSTCQ